MPEEGGPGPGRFPGGGTAPRELSVPADGTLPGEPQGDVDESEYAARLLRYLRDLARARRRPSRDVSRHDHVYWLCELPGDVYVETDAGPGDVLFSVPVIPLTPPAVLEEFDGWLGLRNWYRILRELADQEVVLATGLLAWRPVVHDHLLSTPVRIVVDERTERIDVILAGHTTLRDRELLSGHPGFRAADSVSYAVRDGQGFGLHASVGDVLRTWCSAALSAPTGYRDDWTPDPGETAPVPQIRLAPALVVRPQGRAAVADYHATLLRLLPRGVPEGLARLASPSRRPHVMHVPEREPQTVRDLVVGLLGRGHRVLVATSGAAASGALRAALPEGLTGLTVADPATAVRTADEILTRPAPDVDALTEQEKAAARHAARLRDRLRDGVDDAVGDGGQGPEAELRAEAPELAWMPVRPDLPPGPPISRAEATELVVLLAEETAERKARTAQRDVDPGTLPSAAYVRTLIEAESAAAERAERSETDLSRRLRDTDVTFLARLDGNASVVGAALRDLGLDGHPGGWNSADLAVRAFGDALAGRRALIWTRVAEMTSRVGWADQAVAQATGHRIDLPADADLRALAAAAYDLRAHLVGGGALKRGPLRSAAQRQAEPLLATVRVDGASPTTPELLDLVHTDLLVRITCRELQYVWEAAGISFPADLPPAERVARFVRAHARLGRVLDAMPAVDETRALLNRFGIAVPLEHPVHWHEYAAALRNALDGLGVDRAAADLDALRDSIGPVGDADPPELRAALTAIGARDPDAYARALGALAEARHERSLQVRCEELLTRLRAAHPDLANLMIATDGDEAWHDRVRRWDEAWSWARSAARRIAERTESEEERLRDALAEAEERLRDIRADLTAAHAWAAVRTNLPETATNPPDIVPVWILPLWRVPEVIPPAPGSFDVAIVDGEHEAGAEALFLLWLAPRIILVGPPGSKLPPLEGPSPSTDLPPHLQGVITPTSPLFSALTTRPPTPPAPRPPAPPQVEPDRSPVFDERPAAPLPDTNTRQPQPVETVPVESVPVESVPVESVPVETVPAETVPADPAATAPVPIVRPDDASTPEAAQVTRGRSIVTYKRPELVELVGHIADREPDLTDDQIVELATRLLGCPPDEELLVGARLRYAVQAYRGRA
ncbi:hypothetical protein BZB76_1923 [Actinomadura pelletieri DSM 43383]|uniref:Uncharacterized protein n=1 Tax=Actinomadura pelletieri DSM 43383 TaxID=1120940 RepID=A0A495QT09_9ACTN|nr:hypothetical protein [Actinomadura pelletieri]RKS76567.1 hypothetical protein BZB76_1923 [Actinomadura pelletieri DSM 43383]